MSSYLGTIGLVEGLIHPAMEGTFQMQVIGWRPKIVAAADGGGVVGHAGARARRTEETALPLLHVAARLTRSARRTRLRIAETWPWAADLAVAFDRLAALPRPRI